jgi:phage baseplate assembly protein W
MATGLSPKLPLTVDEADGHYVLNKTIKETASQNLKMLVLTNPGERIMDPDFGVGVRRFLFENNSPLVYDEIRQRIQAQTKKYLGYINISAVIFNEGSADKSQFDSNITTIIIEYSIRGVDIPNILSLPIEL